MAKKVLIQNLSEPLQDARSARFDIDTGTGNLVIDPLGSDQAVLVSGALEYLEKQDPPAWKVEATNGQANLTLKARGGKQTGFRLPWQSCNGETNWQIHLNPAVASDITAHSGGGNIKIDLTGMKITQVCADSGGGNLDMILPGTASDVNITARTGGGDVNVELGSHTTGSNTLTAGSGAGNVVVCLPAGVSAHIHATTGLGKVIVDPRFSQVEKDVYQSPDYDQAADRVEVHARSGAGTVRIITR